MSLITFGSLMHALMFELIVARVIFKRLAVFSRNLLMKVRRKSIFDRELCSKVLKEALLFDRELCSMVPKAALLLFLLAWKHE